MSAPLPNLGLESGFAVCDKDIIQGLNKNFKLLDVLVQLSVLDIVASLPGSPSLGDRYILLTNGSINNWNGTAWEVIQAQDGFVSYVRDVDTIYGYNGTAWIALVQLNASQIPYDNTISGLTATNVKTAIDELANSLNTLVAADISDFSAAANLALAGALAGKANVAHTHPLSDLLQSGAGTGEVPVWSGTAWVPGPIAVTPGDLILPENFSPANPPSPTDLRFFSSARTTAPDMIAEYINNFGNRYPLETNGFYKRRYRVDAIPGGTTFNYLGGLTAFTATGTATAGTLATTNLHQSMPRVEAAVTTAAVGAVAGWRAGQNIFRTGGGSGALPYAGGFRFLMRFGIGRGIAANTNRRLFAGLSSSTVAPTNVDPSTITNIIGVGADTADTNWQFMLRGAGAVLKADTGIAKAVGADNEAFFELEIFARTNNGSDPQPVIISFKDCTNGFPSGNYGQEFTTNLPLGSVFLGPRVWGSTGATSATIGITLMEIITDIEYFKL
jgi:hypothetical protein